MTEENVKDISVGDQVFVKVPPSPDPALAGSATLRKAGARGPRGRRVETPEESLKGIALGQVQAIERYDVASHYFTEEPQRATVTPWLLRKISRGSLVMVDAPAGADGEPARALEATPPKGGQE